MRYGFTMRFNGKSEVGTRLALDSPKYIEKFYKSKSL